MSTRLPFAAGSSSPAAPPPMSWRGAVAAAVKLRPSAQLGGCLGRMRLGGTALLACNLLLAGFGAAAAQGELCFNQLQLLGSHNSYHQAPPQELLQAFGSLTAGPLSAWQFSHPPLPAQLDAGVRAFELDVSWDPLGGRYAQAAGLKMVGQRGWLDDPRYLQPGFKVLHVPDFDFRSSCVLLAECLSEIKAWSDAHPGHLPIVVYLEIKGAGLAESLGGAGALLLPSLQSMLDQAAAEGPDSFIEVQPTTAQTIRDLQGELLATFGGANGTAGSSSGGAHGQLLTPDDVRSALGAAPDADLQQLLMVPAGSGTPCPWPSLDGVMRGKVLAVLIVNAGTPPAAVEEAYPGLVGSLAWVEQDGRTPVPHAVFRSRAVWRLGDGWSMDLPANASDLVATMAQSVEDALAAGFIVRTRADADTLEARADFTARRDALIAAGPQVVSSDFVLPANQQRAQGSDAPLFTTNYNVSLPGGQVARCLHNGSAEPGSMLVHMSGDVAAGVSDQVYCGPLAGAPAGSLTFDIASNDTSPAPVQAAEAPAGSSEAAPLAPAPAPSSGSGRQRGMLPAAVVVGWLAAGLQLL